MKIFVYIPIDELYEEEYPVDTVEQIETAQARMLELGVVFSYIYAGQGTNQYKTQSLLFADD